MDRSAFILAFSAVVSGCDNNILQRHPGIPPAITPCEGECPEVLVPDENTLRPQYREKPPVAGESFVEGTSAETLDKTTQADRDEALDASSLSNEKKLGKTIASLGDVAQQGFWLKTPLVLAESEGRVVWADNGNSVNITLIPLQGESTAGSQISLAAMRTLGIPLTALPELIVFVK